MSSSSRVADQLELGVKAVCDTRIDHQRLEQLTREFDAVLAATGLHVGTQQDDGSWGDLLTTAEVMAALSLTTGYPNLAVSADAVISQLPLETCETINGSWGFNLLDRDHKGNAELIR